VTKLLYQRKTCYVPHFDHHWIINWKPSLFVLLEALLFKIFGKSDLNHI